MVSGVNSAFTFAEGSLALANGSCCCLLNSASGHCHIIGIDFDAEVPPSFLRADHADSTGAEKRIEHHAARRASGQDAGSDQVRGKSCKVGIGERARSYGPHGAAVAGSVTITDRAACTSSSGVFSWESARDHSPIARSSRRPLLRLVAWNGVILGVPTVSGRIRSMYGRLFDGLMVVVVPLGFRQKKNILVRPGGPVFHALGHGIGFVPDDVRPEIPTIRLQRERQTPGDA